LSGDGPDADDTVQEAFSSRILSSSSCAYRTSGS